MCSQSVDRAQVFGFPGSELGHDSPAAALYIQVITYNTLGLSDIRGSTQST